MIRRVAASVVVLLAVGACTAATAMTGNDQPACHTAWAGSETPDQHNGGTFLTFPIGQDATLTRLTGSVSFAQGSGPAGFAEMLVVIGVSPTPLVMQDPLLPVLAPDPVIGTMRVSTRFRHNENGGAVSDGVIAARIIKTYQGAGSALIDEPMSQPLTAGGTLWVRYDSLSTATLDPEVQIVATLC